MRLIKESAISFGVPLRLNGKLIWFRGNVSASQKKMEVWV
ncbi:hypothetical protein LINPERHAP2_LOCUS40949 [Linum perenne]